MVGFMLVLVLVLVLVPVADSHSRPWPAILPLVTVKVGEGPPLT